MKTGKGFVLMAGTAILCAVGMSGRMGMGVAAGDEAVISDTAKACIACHTERRLSGSALRDWQSSKHAAAGVGCDACHIPPSNAPKEVLQSKSSCEDKSVRRSVSSRSCAQCHADQVQQFSAGKHALAWIAMEVMPTTKDQPKALIEGEKGCGGCHRIGRDEGKCDSCHTRHRFAASEARHPEACQTCHMGFDHPQWEMYSTSKHGSIYAIEKNQYDWEVPLKDWFKNHGTASPRTPRAPVCASCHLPGGDHAVRTAWGFLAMRLPEKDPAWMKDRATILQGLGVLDKNGKPTDRLKVVQVGKVARLTAEEWQAERDRMIKVCSQCHTPGYAKEQMARGDEIIRQCDRLMAEAVRIVEGLYRDGVLERPKDYPAQVDLLRFYEVKHPIEQKLYVMFLEHRMRGFQGAFHMNPDYQHWYGWAEMKRDLAEIRQEASNLRKAIRKKAVKAR